MTAAWLETLPYPVMLLLGVPTLPLLAAVMIANRRLRAPALALAPCSGLPALILSVWVPPDVSVELPWLLLGTRLGVDATGQVFLLFTALLWIISALFARHYLAHDPQRYRFSVFYFAAMSGNLGLIVAQDVVSFYLFFALMSFAAYGLIVHEGSEAARRAGRVYLILAIIGEILLFMAFVLAVGSAGTHYLSGLTAGLATAPARNWIIVLVLVGFGIKAGTLLLHMWLPLAHSIAPTPASAVLSGAMVKAGLLGWLRFLPLGAVSLPEWGALYIVAGVEAAFYGVLIGLTQDNPKAVLAYSSISQMGYMAIGVGLGLMVPSLWPLALAATLIYALHHALAKGALFLGVGVAAASSDPVRMRWVMAGLLVPALALAGAPFTSGAVAKAYLKEALLLASAPRLIWLASLLPIAALGTSLLLGRFLFLVWQQRGAPGQSHASSGTWRAWVLALLSVTTVIWLLLENDASHVLQRSLALADLWSTTWPVLAGIAVTFVAWRFLSRFDRPWYPQLPAGDMLELAVWWGNTTRSVWQACCRVANTIWPQALELLWRRDQPHPLGLQGWWSERLEAAFRLISVAGILFLLLLLTLFVLLASREVTP